MPPKKKIINKKKRSLPIDPKPSTSTDYEVHKSNDEISKRKKQKVESSKPDTFENTYCTSLEENIIPIAHLNPFQNKGAIKVRVMTKKPIHTWNNSKSSGKLFSMDLMDSSGQIRATIFQDLVNRFFDKFEQNKIYYISGADIKNANKQYSMINNNFELIFNDNTEVKECAKYTV